MRAQVFGVAEMAEFLGVAVTTVYSWAARNQRPEPDYASVNGFPAWRRLSLLQWAARTGRLPPWLADEGKPYIPSGGPVKRRALNNGDDPS